MRIAIIGAGFTGLTAAYTLSKQGYSVTVFEKNAFAGGLASGIRHVVDNYPTGWQWDLERFYHHWFTNDEAIRNLIRELGAEEQVLVQRPLTATWYKGRAYQLDTPLALLKFSPLSLRSRLQTGLALAYLKYFVRSSRVNKFETITADVWLKRWMGNESYQLLWEPLLKGKFNQYYRQINMTWFWARIFKRTPKLAYFRGGFGALVNLLVEKVQNQGSAVLFSQNIKAITQTEDGRWRVQVKEEFSNFSLRASHARVPASFDAVIVTTPPPVLSRLLPNLPQNYRVRLTSSKAIGALVLVLVLDRPFLDNNIYWLNINHAAWPFLAVVEHTNFVDPSHYGGKHILYVGDYLPRAHRRMQMTKEELVQEFLPYLQQLNPKLAPENLNLNTWLFREAYAQPIVGLNHSKKILPIQLPLPNIYLASMAQVYPWDRGTNYAVELGQRVANLVTQNS